eukprot:CAMPEP_0201108088 /NCGR_PEP_ID=MMETSP0812-20130820/59770_1 /ASSEMBLY_ACC=CAM_ASM_000668 /TAXON_ID=98059 /ORGANISM="Dinobryon sp., Strain UTEXLB2267" /LENGTH=78 /DNA_ID=CAMNT_0047369321 /DNA_START=105 /DNA_END=341 /DNA_ORIENTATION=-
MLATGRRSRVDIVEVGIGSFGRGCGSHGRGSPAFCGVSGSVLVAESIAGCDGVPPTAAAAPAIAAVLVFSAAGTATSM